MVMAGMWTAISSDKHLEPLLPEDAEHKRDAEKHEVGIGGRHTADHAGLRVAPEDPRRHQMPGGPGDGAAAK